MPTLPTAGADLGADAFFMDVSLMSLVSMDGITSLLLAMGAIFMVEGIRSTFSRLHGCFNPPPVRKVWRQRQVLDLYTWIEEESTKENSAYMNLKPPSYVFRVLSNTREGLVYIGSGFRMGSYLYTAKHVIDAARVFSPEIVYKSGDFTTSSVDWVEIHDDVYCAEIPIGFAIKKAKVAVQRSSTVSIVSGLDMHNASSGTYDMRESPIWHYNGSTRAGFSGAPYTCGYGDSAPIIGMHLSGGSMNSFVSASYLEAITSKGLKSINEAHYGGDDDSATRVVKAFMNKGGKPVVHRETPDDVILQIGEKFYQVDREDYAEITRPFEYESAVPKNCGPSPVEETLTHSPLVNNVLETVYSPVHHNIDGLSAQNKIYDLVLRHIKTLESSLKEIMSAQMQLNIIPSSPLMNDSTASTGSSQQPIGDKKSSELYHASTSKPLVDLESSGSIARSGTCLAGTDLLALTPQTLTALSKLSPLDFNIWKVLRDHALDLQAFTDDYLKVKDNLTQ